MGKREERRRLSFAGLASPSPVCGLCIQEQEEARLLPGSPSLLACPESSCPVASQENPEWRGVGLESTLASGLYWPGTKDSQGFIFLTTQAFAC